ncbi:GvpL/GvpF family gas vesicle protein [Streptomyces sp. 2P-4]|uniref:GvpL/GvpF family gas vesicle protein n=1 Tax=Streptomyces sp. 2P-4 TaxID=2931974 RepID=UPI0025403211|nr:GvpL/GvpF family gas vesicle protein [Streptomyces sp. 2P-4]
MNTPSAAPSLVYAYAATPPAPALEHLLPALTGVAGSPVTLLALTDPGRGPAAALAVSDVPRSEWDEAALKARFEDLDWLEETARAHHRVIEELAAHTTVLPLRLATLYADRASALADLRRHGQALATGLARLSGHTEYGVKLYVRPAAAPDPSRGAAPQPSAAGASASRPGAGRAYLQARRAHQHARDDHYAQARTAAERIAALAAPHAADHVRHPAQSGPLTASGAEENVLNDAYLVRDAEAEAFREAVHTAVRGLSGIRLELTGPWAPYSFAAPLPPPTAAAP